ncbi:MAG: hypothetical protein ACRDJ5_10700 [Actinomycetota bacterium]
MTRGGSFGHVVRSMISVVVVSATACSPAGRPSTEEGASLASRAERRPGPHRIECRESVVDLVEEEPAFAPPARRVGGRTLVPVTFPDGTSVELVYPSRLDLAGLGVYPGTSAALADPYSTRGLDMSRGVARALVEGDTPLGCYRGFRGSQVELWRAADPDRYIDYWLFFRFGAWTVAIWDDDDQPFGLSERQRARWAAGLRARETRRGWLVFGSAPPLRLHVEEKGWGDPHLQFGNLRLTLFPADCRPFEEVPTTTIGSRRVHLYKGTRHWFAEWCDPLASMVATMEGTGRFLRSVARELEVRAAGP